MIPLIFLATILPAIVSFSIFFIKEKKRQTIVALISVLVSYFIILTLFVTKGKIKEFLFYYSEKLTLYSIPVIDYIDGISFLMITATAVLYIAIIIYSYSEIKERYISYTILILLLYTSLIGIFVTETLPIFYIYWEFMLIPSTLLILWWGGEKRYRSSIKFFLFTHASSLLMLIAIAILVSHGIVLISQLHSYKNPDILYIMSLFTIALLTKQGIFPLHTWLPDAHSEAPTPISAILSGIIIETGGYTFYRIVLSQNIPQLLYITTFLALLSAFYGGILALKENNVKRIAAYSSISHAGYIILGLSLGGLGSIYALIGGLFHLLSHAVSKGLFFLVSGTVSHLFKTKDIRKMGLLMKNTRFTSFFGLISSLSLAGVPILACFPGEFMIIVGGVQSKYLEISLAFVFVLIISAAYALRFWLKIFWHPTDIMIKSLPEETDCYRVIGMFILAVAIITIGILFTIIIDYLLIPFL
ncbi:MAG: NADH-quinone oxidoreductase subunit M [Thermoproteales archaeon]|nr:NADH-quinone oxidoreductase subunit M [Thermoproteales archaeon]